MGGAIRIESSENLSSATLDAMKMKRVLINFMMNAVQASPEGEIVAVCSYRIPPASGRMIKARPSIGIPASNIVM